MKFILSAHSALMLFYCVVVVIWLGNFLLKNVVIRI